MNTLELLTLEILYLSYLFDPLPVKKLFAINPQGLAGLSSESIVPSRVLLIPLLIQVYT
jgi:hypothetical protein